MTAPDGRGSPWFQRFKPAPEAGIRLVCLPHAGGSASFFLEVARALHPEADVLSVQYPGRQERWREPAIESLTDLAERIAAELVPWTDRPLALFGHSYGALLGYEIARRLTDQGRPPVVLFASGRGAPSIHRPELRHLMSDRDLVRQLAALGGTDARVLQEEEILTIALPAIRADYRAVHSYRHRPGPPLTCPVTALTGSEDPMVTLEEAAAWRAHTAGEFETISFPGGHFYLISRIDEVIGLVAARLAELPRPGR